jgi:hypothetical protein
MTATASGTNTDSATTDRFNQDSAQVGAARLVMQEHRRVCVPEPACNGCLATWPCPDVVAAWLVLPGEQ